MGFERAPSKGKVEIGMIINSDSSNESNIFLKIVQTKMFRGDPSCVRGISANYLLIGVRSKIQLFEWKLSDKIDDEFAFELHHLYTIHNNTYLLDIKVHGDFFIVIDLMKSISMFLLTQNAQNSMNKLDQIMIDGTALKKNGKNDEKCACVISEVARDYDPSWMRCGEIYNSEFVVGIDSYCNFFVLKRNIDSLNEDERGRLDVVCRMYWGDDINTITHGSLVMDIPNEKIKSDKIEMDVCNDDND